MLRIPKSDRETTQYLRLTAKGEEFVLLVSCACRRFRKQICTFKFYYMFVLYFIVA